MQCPEELTRTRFVNPNWPAVIARSTAAHGEPVEPRGNLDEAEHTSTNRRCYGDEIANPRIEYGGAMTKRVRVRLKIPWLVK